MTKVPEITADIPARTLLPSCEGMDRPFILSMHSWSVQVGLRAVLIDAALEQVLAKRKPSVKIAGEACGGKFAEFSHTLE